MENWKDIKGYEGIYKISSYGQVLVMPRKKTLYHGGVYYLKKTILKPSTRSGYLIIVLTKNYKRKTFSVHRLVAQSFINNEHKKPEINHKNGIRKDNNVENLEWVTASENVIHSYKILKRKPSHKKFHLT